MHDYGEVDAPLSRIDPAAVLINSSGNDSTGLMAIWNQYKRLFLAVFFSVIALGAVYIFGSHKKYQSKMELLVQNGRSENGITAGRSEAPASVHEINENELYSELELLQSADVLDEAIDPGWAQIPFNKRPVAELNKHNQAVGLLRSSLYVVPLRKSYILDVELTTRNPYQANEQLNSLLSAYMSEKRKISHPGGATALFAQQAESYKQQWMTAEQEFATFQRDHHLVSIKDQEGSLEKQILELDTGRREAEVSITEFEHKVEGDKAELARIPVRHATRETSIPATGSIDTMRSKLSELTLQKTELLAKYKPSDRLVVEVDEKIRNIEAALNDYQSLHSAETTSDINPTYQAIEQDLSETTTRMAAIKGRRAAIMKQLEDLQRNVSLSEQAQQSYNYLANKVSELQSNYQLYAAKRDQASMTEAMDQHQLLNVAVVEIPTLSLVPVRPRPLTDGLLTVLTALFLAAVAVFLAYNRQAEATGMSTEPHTPKYPILSPAKDKKELQNATALP